MVYTPYSDKQVSAEEFKTIIGDTDAVTTGWNHPQITREMVEGTNLKYITHTGGSVGSLVTSEIFDMGIRVFSGNPIFPKSVAEGTIAYILIGLRKTPYVMDEVKCGG